jgi:hypothetical protein
MIFRIADDCDLTAVGSYHVTLGDAFGRVVGAFRVDVWLEGEEELFDCRLVENRDVGYRLEGGHDLRAFGRGQDWPTGTFLNRDLLVRVDTDDQYVAEFSSAREITDVADVKYVEAAVSEDDTGA